MSWTFSRSVFSEHEAALQIYKCVNRTNRTRKKRHGMNGMKAADLLFPAIRRYHGGLVGTGIFRGACWEFGYKLNWDAGLFFDVLLQMLPLVLRALDFVEAVGDFETRAAVDFTLKFIFKIGSFLEKSWRLIFNLYKAQRIVIKEQVCWCFFF